MSDQQEHYLAYLLRLWRSPDQERKNWRASLEAVDTRQKMGFASLEELFAFLGEQASSSEDENSQFDRNRS